MAGNAILKTFLALFENCIFNVLLFSNINFNEEFLIFVYDDDVAPYIKNLIMTSVINWLS
jgi:hypothetical protein